MYRYLSRNLTQRHKTYDLLVFMYICQMYRYVSRGLTHTHDGNLSYLKIAILEKCQITWFLSGDLTCIHKKLALCYFFLKICKYVRGIDIYHVIWRIYIKLMICLRLCIYVRCIDIYHEIWRKRITKIYVTLRQLS